MVGRIVRPLPTFELAEFTPAEAQTIAGVNVASQRDWRRQGYLPSHEGHARYNLFDLCQLRIMSLLAERGIGPRASLEPAARCTPGLALMLLRRRESWNGHADRTLTWVDERLLGRTHRPTAEELWQERAKWLVDNSAREWTWRDAHVLFNLDHTGYFVWFSDDSSDFYDDLFDLYSIDHADPRISGAMVLIDLKAQAEIIARAAARPFASVRFGIFE